MSAPCWTRSFTQAKWPFLAATISGVWEVGKKEETGGERRGREMGGERRKREKREREEGERRERVKREKEVNSNLWYICLRGCVHVNIRI